MKKILIIGLSPNLGGIETFIKNMIYNLNMSNFEVHILNGNEQNIAFYEFFIKNNIIVHNITPRNVNYIKHLKELKNLFKSNKFNIIHYNIMNYSWFEPILCAIKYSPCSKIILHSHCGNKMYIKTQSFKTKLINLLGKKLLNKVDVIRISCGEDAGKYFFNGKPFEIINNGIDFDKFSFNLQVRSRIRKELKIEDDDICIGLVAAFFKVKNHTFLLDIFNDLKKKNKKFKLILIGEGPLLLDLKNRVSEYYFSKDIYFLGKIENTNEYYSAMDLYVMPSLSEGFSISLCEAQINGLKCYTSTNVDFTSNISGNVSFVSLEESSDYWSDLILRNGYERDINVLNKISNKYNSIESYKKIFRLYNDL